MTPPPTRPTTRLFGLLPVLSTPFDEHRELDVESLRRLVRFQLAAGADGLAVFGMASEGFALTAAERCRILEVVTEEVAGRIPIIAGISPTSTATAIEQAELAAAGGSDVLMVLPPYMVKPSPHQLVEFFGEVAEAAGLDVMVQDAPNATAITMPVPVIAELCRIPGVTSVKVEASPTPPKIAAVKGQAPGSIAVLGGANAFFLLEEMRSGAVGTMPACEFTDALAEVLRAIAADDWATARKAYERLLPLIRFGIQPGIAWAVHKHVLVRRGIIASSAVRLPSHPLDDTSSDRLDEILDELALPSYADVVGEP